MRALGVWGEHQRKLTWTELQGAAGLDLRTVDIALFDVIDDVTTFPLPFLLARAAGAEPRADWASASASYRATCALVQIGHSEERPTLDTEQRKIVSSLLDDLKRGEAQIREEMLEDPDDEYVLEELDSVLHDQDGLSRLLGLNINSPR